jgi:hypothetical protein
LSGAGLAEQKNLFTKKLYSLESLQGYKLVELPEQQVHGSAEKRKTYITCKQVNKFSNSEFCKTNLLKWMLTIL